MTGGQFGENLRREIYKHYQSIREFAAEMGVQPANVYWWCSEQHMPGGYMLVDIADTLGVTIDSLFGR